MYCLPLTTYMMLSQRLMSIHCHSTNNIPQLSTVLPQSHDSRMLPLHLNFNSVKSNTEGCLYSFLLRQKST